MKQYLALISNCIIVQGYNRSTICDLDRQKIHLIPNSLAGLFNDNRILPIKDIQSSLTKEEKGIFDEYLEYLYQEELIFKVTPAELEHFPKLSEQWRFPAHIINCLLDADNEIPYFDNSFLNQLSELCCNYIEIRFFNAVTMNYLHRLLKIIADSQIKAIELLIPEFDQPDFNVSIRRLVKENGKIETLWVYSATESCILNAGNFSGMGKIVKTKNKVDSKVHCGIIESDYFTPNILHYTESLHHNTCLNRKISIDADGNIKNCPSMKESYGNIRDTTLKEAIEKPGFKKYWNITKDQISVCKDCEFRHVCTDCRAYLEDPGDVYSKPLKCGYNPYTCEWEEWSTNPLKQKAIDYYGMRELVKTEPKA